MLQWQVNRCHCNFSLIKLASLTVATAEVGASNSDINILKHKASRRHKEGWVYESIKIGFPEVMRTSAFVPHPDELVVICVGPGQNNSVLLKSVDLEKSDDPIAQHMIFCNYCHKERGRSSCFKVVGCRQAFTHRCIERKSMYNTSNKTDQNFYSR